MPKTGTEEHCGRLRIRYFLMHPSGRSSPLMRKNIAGETSPMYRYSRGSTTSRCEMARCVLRGFVSATEWINETTYSEQTGADDSHAVHKPGDCSNILNMMSAKAV
eukprot:6022935-Pleurochrysis_carterae.AAC.2